MKHEYNLRIVSGEVDEKALKRSIKEILSRVNLCTFATMRPDGTPHITNVFFAVTPELQIATLTSPSSGHGRNVKANPRVEISIADTTQSPTAAKQGLELTGTMRPASVKETLQVFGVYMKRFQKDFSRKGESHKPKMSKMLHSRAYLVDIEVVKVLDEQHLENDTMYVAEVSR